MSSMAPVIWLKFLVNLRIPSEQMSRAYPVQTTTSSFQIISIYSSAIPSATRRHIWRQWQNKSKKISMSLTKIDINHSWTGHIIIIEPQRTTKLITNRVPKCTRLIDRLKLLQRITVFSMVMERTCFDVVTYLFTNWLTCLFISC